MKDGVTGHVVGLGQWDLLLVASVCNLQSGIVQTVAEGAWEP